MKKVLLCGHTGSNNRGCEAIIRSTALILKRHIKNPIYFTSYYPIEDETLSKDVNISGIVPYNVVNGLTIDRIRTSFTLRLTRDYYYVQKIFQKFVWRFLAKNSVAINVGGDTYCYSRDARLPSYGLNRFCFKNNIPIIFWGCSVEKSNIDVEMINDLSKYSLIITRESVSYNNLLEAGLDINKLKLYPDPAFALPTVSVTMPDILKGDVVGINISPLVVDRGLDRNLIIKNFELLIEYILENSNRSIALIPHVFYDGKQDVEIMSYFEKKYSSTGRIYLFKGNFNSMQLKYIISKCRFLIAARTHASIAAYSTCVPTLVVGYSVKSIGLAKDIFGSSENYVLPIIEFQLIDDLLNRFKYIEKNENLIKTHLQHIMPEYIMKAENAGSEICNFMK